MTILDVQTGGEVYTLFPSCFSRDGFVRGGVEHRIPAPTDGYEITVGGPAGIERLKAIATRTPHQLTEPPLCAETAFRSLDADDRPRMRNLEISIKKVPESERAVASTYFRIR